MTATPTTTNYPIGSTITAGHISSFRTRSTTTTRALRVAWAGVRPRTLRDNFDALYREGEQTPKMMTVALHCRLAGKPARTAAFARFVDHILRHDRVWICRRNEIAEHWRRQHPARDSVSQP